MKKYFSYIGVLIGGVLLGWFLFGGLNKEKDYNHVAVEQNDQIWTCSMHPQIKMSEAGDCPICGMDLIPLSTLTNEDNPMNIRMSPTAMQLANVQTEVVSKGDAIKDLLLNGKVTPDERRVSTQTSHINGRVEDLKINYTGEQVSEGQILAYVYSPELISAQKEMFEARKIIELQPSLFRAAKEKLKNWKLSDNTIEKIINSGKIIENFPIRADISGVVTEKFVNVGEYIKLGEPLYEISNLSSLWILFDLYESDLGWVKKGDNVEYSINAIVGEKYSGRIAYIDPVINIKTRTAKARVEVSNSKNLLKPEMLVTGVVKSKITTGSDKIVVPKSAVMWTGTKSIVYKKVESTQGVEFILTDIVLGPSLGNSYVILTGLKEGDEIATNGTFSIDAAAQLAGKPSMMNPRGGKKSIGHNHGATSNIVDDKMTNATSLSTEANKSLSELYSSYLKVKNDLVKDDFEKSHTSSLQFSKELGQISMSLFEGENHDIWMRHSITLKKLISKYIGSKDIQEAREHFIHISEQMIMMSKSLKPKVGKLYIQYCPMADRNKGARWLSKEKEVMNPYFGKAMLTCGEVKEEI